MGKRGIEPLRLAAHDPKSCLSASSSTSPRAQIISQSEYPVNKSGIIGRLFYQSVNILEVNLGRVINPETAGKERTQLVRGVVLALRELARQTAPDAHTRDMAAFIVLALEAIWATIDTSVAAWEKRGYWVKADRFRMEWMWSSQLGQAMRQAVLAEDWGQVAQVAAQVAVRLSTVKLPQRHRLGTPWDGAWQRLVS